MTPRITCKDYCPIVVDLDKEQIDRIRDRGIEPDTQPHSVLFTEVPPSPELTNVFISPMVPDNPVTMASDADREWFEQNPGRFIRLRWSTDGDPAGENNTVIVFCPHPGYRIRLAINMSKDATEWAFLHGTPHADADLTALLFWIINHVPADLMMRRSMLASFKGRFQTTWH